MTFPKLSACVLGCGLLAVTAAAQPHPSFERGFDPAKMYQFDNVDTINLLNGNTIISIPIGPSYPVSERLSYRLTLVYNSKVWDHRQIGTCDQPIPVRQSNAGMGWRLSLGTLLSPTDAANVDDYGYWVYIGADGAVHRFYSKLHETDTENDPSDYYQYTRDGSYIRMRYMSSVQRAIEFPDGLFQTFQLSTWPGGYNEWRIIGISDRFNDRPGGLPNVLVQYPTATTMQLSDQFGRTQTVTFTSDSTGWYARLVQSVTLTAFNGTTATYTFSYLQSQTVGVPSEPGICNNWLNVNVPQLSSVFLPDSTSWGVQTYTTGQYASGAISALWLPTGGRIAYVYGLKLLPVSECSGRRWLSQSGAVATRTFYDAAGASLGAWTYSSVLSASPTGWCDNQAYPKPQEEMQVTVVSPPGDKTVHYFSVFPGWSDSGGYTGSFLPEEYGLPLSHAPASDGGASPRFLSIDQFACPGGTCPASPVRQAYGRYERDTGVSCGVWGVNFGPDCLNSNRRVAGERTLFRDDPNSSCTGYPTSTCRTSTNDHSSFDGLGHYRTTTTGGNFGAGDVRTATTNHNPGSGTYPSSFVPWPTANPWVINTYDSQQVTENSTYSKAEYCFDSSTGYLNRKRTLKSGTTEGTADLIVAFTVSTAGNTTSEQYFGGDTQTLSTGSLCSLTLPANQYRLDHTYQNGVRKTSRYYDGSGNPLSFYILDQDIDANIGLPSRSRDSAGVYTDYTYDAMNRVTWVKPQTSFNGGAWFQNVYTNASGTNPARVNIYAYPNGSTTGALGQEEYSFDAFGRLGKKRQLLASGAWNQRLYAYNALGWRTSVSEVQADGTSGSNLRNTLYSNFDPFGRPGTVTPSDGTTHNVTLTYTGVRQVVRTVKVATSPTGETDAVTTEVYDRQGRLYQVTEQSGTSGANVTTTYGYDVGNHLKQTSTTSGSTTQNRYFTYDNRGFLTSEQLPEKGANGNGLVNYYTYDPGGHVGRVVDGPNDLTFSYDRAERLTQVRETGGGQRTLKSFTFATANGSNDWANGKLRQAIANNWFDPAAPTSNFLSQETYTYGGVGGRISQRDTLAGIVGGNQGTFTQGFTWSDLGVPATVTYPQKAGVGPARTVTFDLTNGWLTRVHEGTTDYASSISYHANGMVNQVTRPNSTTDTFAKDANDIARPASVTVRGPLGVTLWTTGTYGYDGSGNVKSMVNGSNTDTFVYDKVSRLLEGKITSVAKKQCNSYDAFGNIKGQATVASSQTCTPSSWSVDSGTNRFLSPITYDAAGEQLSWNSGGYTYRWYPTGQMRQFDGSGRTTIHGYTADGERVGTYDSYAPAGITYTLRNLDGKVLRIYKESGGVWTWVQDYVYRDGAHLATIDGTGTRHFHLDHLGSIRLITNSSGSQVALHTYLPFGQEATSTTQDAERIKFTGHERDLRDPSNTTDDLDYMHARSTNPNLGRFLSVDPRRDADPKSPQSWNLYAYVRNNPLTLTDPTGESPLLDWLRKLFSGQWVEDLLKQQVIERTKPQGEKTEEQKQEERQLLEAADLAQSNQGAIVGTGAAKVAEGAREGITDVAGPIVREGASAIAFAGAAKGAQAVRRLAGGLAEASTVLRQAERWLGPGYKEIAPGVFRSADGLRQFRMTARDLAGHGGRMGAHVNFEALAPNGRVIENTHVLLEGK